VSRGFGLPRAYSEGRKGVREEAPDNDPYPYGSKTTTNKAKLLLIAYLPTANRVHQVIRGIDFDTAILPLLPEHYILAELRASSIAQIGNLAECSDTDFLAIPEERRHELR
jgi:hypothetical protein